LRSCLYFYLVKARCSFLCSRSEQRGYTIGDRNKRHCLYKEGRVLLANSTQRTMVRLLSFLLPAAILLLVFARLGVYPFGPKSLLVVDMNSEYIDYYMQLNTIFREKGSFLRSQDMGMGLNMLGLIAFYTASPLNILVLLSPVHYLTETVLLITLIKFGLCGLFFSLYTTYTFGRTDGVNLGASVAYAMMGYNLAYSSNLMWLDGAALLPLVLMGVEKILREEKYLSYIISLIFLFWCSYYIGYMAGVFTFLYFTFRFFTQPSAFAHYVKKLWRFLGGAALAAGCCAVLLLPAFLNLLNGQEKLMTFPKRVFSSFYPIIRLASKLVPGVYDSLTDSGLPHIFITTAAVLLALLFFLNKEIPLREKMVFALFSGVMILSLSWEALDLAWHAFEDPTWFPARYSFVFCFLVLHLGLRGLARPQGLVPTRILVAMGIWLLVLFEIAVSKLSFVQTRHILLGSFLTLCYGGVLLAMRRNLPPSSRQLLILLGVCLLCAECFYSADAQIQGIEGQFHYRTRAGYYAYRERYLPAVEWLKGENPGVYRMEVVELRNANGPMALGYPGISHYSTTTDQRLNTLLRRLGYNTGTINELRFAKNNPFTNGWLGIRYLLTTENPGFGYEWMDSVGQVNIYENPAAFPLAFFAEHKALEMDAQQQNPFDFQNKLSAALIGEESMPPFQPLEVVEESLDNFAFSDKYSGIYYYYRTVSGAPGSLSYTLANPQGLASYAFFPVYNRRFSKAQAYSDGIALGRELSYRNNTVLYLGDEEYPQVRLEVESDRVYLDDMLFYGLDLKAAQYVADLAQQRAMTFTRFQDTAIDGEITAPHDGILATTLPYDTGWTVKIDGKKAPLQRLAGVFLSVELPAGTHKISMRYRPPGWLPGLAVSATCVAGMVLWQVAKRRKE
jgi:uncharacterized membrane protein YfhO